MPLATTSTLIAEAASRNGAVGAFNVITLEHIEGVISGAESVGAPVLLQISQNAVAFHGGAVLPLAAAAQAAAAAASVPISLHLDHVTDFALLQQCANAGFSSAMFDAGSLPFDENVAITKRATDWCHSNGIWIEAEIGYIGGKPSDLVTAHSVGARTDPDEAERFARATGVDALAVAVGSSHAMTSRTAAIDHELIRRLSEAVPVPLVLHGSSGVSDTDLSLAITAGIRKVNIGTALNIAYTSAVRDALRSELLLVDPRRYLEPARTQISETVASLIRVVELSNLRSRQIS